MSHRTQVALVVTALMVADVASAQRRGQRQSAHPNQQSQGQVQQNQRDQRMGDRPFYRGGSDRNATRPDQNQRRQKERRTGDWLRQHADLPPKEQERALDNDPSFRALPPQQQERLRQRLQKFNSLPPDRRERILQRMRAWETLSPEQKDQGRMLFQRFRGLPEDRRREMVWAVRNLRAMSPAQQQQYLNSSQFHDSFSDDERDILRGMMRLNIGPAHHNDPGDDGPQN